MNYEIGLRGKAYLESSSKKMILNKSVDFLNDSQDVDMRKFRKPAQEIQE